MNRISLYSFLIFISLSKVVSGQNAVSTAEIETWKDYASRARIIRDSWGVPHIYGKSDADAVFGLMYAQCEDGFDRIERNYIGVMGRKAEAFGESYLFEDLRQRLFLDSMAAIDLYGKSPQWLQKILIAWAAGMNYYLYTHPEVKPRIIRHFEPWMPLLFSEGSIGGDISTVPLSRIRQFYGYPEEWNIGEGKIPVVSDAERGSNGIAIAGKKSASGNALLLINPHTTFYFRTEVHVVSEEGLNAYGAVTWGQFFVYQGFNEKCGWMHTSSSTDVIDEYAEVVSQKKPYKYKFGKNQNPVIQREITLKYLKDGMMKQRRFEASFTHHGPITGKSGKLWISTALMNNPLEALQQSYLRTKADGLSSFEKIMELRTNSSNNTVFADQDGQIAYWQGNFIPVRRAGLNTEGLIEGSNPANDWQGLHKLSEIIQFKNPPGGWLQNCNSSPYEASGNRSDLNAVYPAYMGADKQNFRAINAIRQLKESDLISLEQLQKIAYNPRMPAFEILIPALMESIKALAFSDSPEHSLLKEAYTVFESWDATWSAESVATTLAILWGKALQASALSGRNLPQGGDDIALVEYMANKTSDSLKCTLLIACMQGLEHDFGTWRVKWGEYNRFQRHSDEFEEVFLDSLPSVGIPFAGGFWGCLASYDARKTKGNIRQYGNGGNAFVALVEFGQRLRAYTIVPGGQSSHPTSPHFNDQSPLFSQTRLKPVAFYREDVEKDKQRDYQPGF